MYPVKTKETNIIIGERQSEYKPLPAHISSDGQIVTTVWKLTWKERLRVLFGRNIKLYVWTFNQPLQPLLMELEE